MRRLLVAGLSLALLTGCTTGMPLSTRKAKVVDYFSPPAPHPGLKWTKDGRPVDGQELNSIAGPQHCDWQSAVMMHLGWPLGTVAVTSEKMRQFIRDPQGAVGQNFRDKLALAAKMPADAQDTGYRSDGLGLWLAPSDPNSAYLRAGDDVERWPRADPVVACD